MVVRHSNVLGWPLAGERGNRNFKGDILFRCKPEISRRTNILGSKYSVMGMVTSEKRQRNLLTSHCLIM